jgi:hypothetical protein
MRDAGRVTATTGDDGREGHDCSDYHRPRGKPRWWLVTAATVLITGSALESLLWADAYSYVSLKAPMLAAFGNPAVVDDDVIIVARPTHYGLLARVGGVLRLDGRCLFVDHPAGFRSAVVWPAGTRWASAERTVVYASGAQIRLGDTFYTAGCNIPARQLNPTGLRDPSSLDRAIACGRHAGGNVVLLGPFPVDVEEE